MPELPEVETVRQSLVPHLEGRRLDDVILYRSGLRFPFPDDFSARLSGARVLAVRRRAKYLLIELDRGETLLSHLGMSGRFLVDADTLPHRHVRILLEPGGAASHVDYIDPRRFGFMDLARSDQLDQHPRLKSLGPEPLSADFNPSLLHDRLASRNQPIKLALLDQVLVAGLGNIYVCEALFGARISPDRGAASLTTAECTRLHQCIVQTLERATVAGGSSLKDFKNTNGASGYFQHDFKVYGREEKPCVDCGRLIVRTVQSGRSTFACAACQS